MRLRRYSFMSLTSDLKNGGPAKAFFDLKLPAHRRVQQRWRSAIGEVVVPHASEGSAQNFGLAADHFLVGVAAEGLGWGSGGYPVACRVNPRLADAMQEIVEGPLCDLDRAARASWYCGLLDSVGRGFRLLSDPALAPFVHGRSLQEVLDQVPRGVVEELMSLLDANHDVLARLPKQRKKGPAFVSSILVGGADCDLLAGTSVVELKTVSDEGLDKDYLRQLVGYVLLDTTDELALTAVTLWFTRHAFALSWTIAELLAELSGSASLTLQEWRAEFEAHLVNWQGSRTVTPAQRRRAAPGEQLRLFETAGIR